MQSTLKLFLSLLLENFSPDDQQKNICLNFLSFGLFQNYSNIQFILLFDKKVKMI